MTHFNSPCDLPGVKYDAGKPQFSLVPPLAHEAHAEVLTFGAAKYAPDNWRKVDNAQTRYIDAALRHVNAHVKGEHIDPESNLMHLAHAIASLSFALELLIESQGKNPSPLIEETAHVAESVTHQPASAASSKGSPEKKVLYRG